VELLRAEVAGLTFDLAPVFTARVGELILGRSDLFRAFVVTFDERAKETILDPYEET
jgi:hypothetical protein